jgi:hypothetical protein
MSIFARCRGQTCCFAILIVAGAWFPSRVIAAPEHDELAPRASAAMASAAAFYRDEIAVHGSYGWRYSADLTYRRGEALLTPSQGWVQPPGTPAVGLALLQAYAATGDRTFLDGAAEAARALAATQLESGGWHAMIEFDPEQRKAWCYRVTPADQRDAAARAENKLCDATTIDDNISQSALELLMRVDVALEGDDPQIRDAVFHGLGKFIEAQYPNGAWPVRFDRRVPNSHDWAALRARYPKTWSRTWVEITDRLFYSTNDNLIGDMIHVFLVAHRLYGREEYLATAIRAGEFLLAAQLPAPQPGWAQQYNREMEPIWGRKFEPPAVASWETRRAIDALLDLYLATGFERYREAAGRAAAWLEASPLPDGRWARYYELRTNRPLYMTSDYRLTHDDGDTPRHYSFKGRFDVPRALERYRNGAPIAFPPPRSSPCSEMNISESEMPAPERARRHEPRGCSGPGGHGPDAQGLGDPLQRRRHRESARSAQERPPDLARRRPAGGAEGAGAARPGPGARRREQLAGQGSLPDRRRSLRRQLYGERHAPPAARPWPVLAEGDPSRG